MRMRVILLLLSSMLVSGLPSTGQAQSPPLEIPGEAIVRFIPEAVPESILVLVDAEIIDSLTSLYTFLVAFPDNIPVSVVIEALEQHPEVSFADANLRVGLPEILQMSQGFSDQQAEAYNEGSTPSPYYGQKTAYGMGFDSAQMISNGQGMTVAVIDNGIDLSHPLFDGRLHPAMYDFVGNDTDPSEEPGEAYSHGTFVSGLILLGAPGSQVLPLRAFGPDGYGDIFAITKALYHAVENQADLINMSFGVALDNIMLRTAVEDALASGVAVIAAAGNEGDSLPVYPAAYPGVITVTALDTLEYVAGFSNYGDHVDIAAPGVNLYSAWAGQYDWGTWSGTSFSAPLVSAVCALLKAEQPSLTPDDLTTEIRATARRTLAWGTVVPPDPFYGWGAVDAFSALVDIHRGDLDLSGLTDIADLTALIDLLFINFTPPPVTERTADLNCSGTVDIADLTALIDHLFINFADPPPCR